MTVNGKRSEHRENGKSSKATVSILAIVLLVLVSASFFFSENGDDDNYDILGAGGYEPMVAAGSFHSLALKYDGTVWAWGDNSSAQLGDGTHTDRSTPVRVSGLTNVIAITAGASHSLALKSDGTVWAWGSNGNGRLGDGTTTERRTPVQVSGLTDVTAIAAGNIHSLALKSDGTVWAWGSNTLGRLGDGTTTERRTPVQVSGLTDVKAIAAGGNHSLALKGDSTVWSWGHNGHSQLGDNSSTDSSIPVQVRGLNNSGFLTDVEAIAAGEYHSLALGSEGTVWSWGGNGSGQLGDASTATRNTPVRVSAVSGTGPLTGVKMISAGWAHSLALRNDGTVCAWGHNSDGRLGDGTTSQRTRPVQVMASSGVMTDVKLIGDGGYHSVTLRNDGTVWSWGHNGHGQLGDDTKVNRNNPVRAEGFNTNISNDSNGPNLLLIAAVLIAAIAATAAAWFFSQRNKKQSLRKKK
ncbi:MAG: hypothetical protein LBE47_02495 [Methanomassiliicoccaceae archaeon]|jgi:alpha-tubulin suppressor-like RCC1 family protein|nr:hypothetical protein [Methanomassiliicoccaceae archaeon]